MFRIGIVQGDLLGYGFLVGFDIGVPFIMAEVDFVYGGKPEQRSHFDGHFASMPRVISEDTGFVATLEFGHLRQLTLTE